MSLNTIYDNINNYIITMKYINTNYTMNHTYYDYELDITYEYVESEFFIQ